MVKLNLKALNFYAAALAWVEEGAPIPPGMPALLAERFEFMMFEIAMEVEGKCYCIVFCCK
jgi:hypothetical protein